MALGMHHSLGITGSCIVISLALSYTCPVQLASGNTGVSLVVSQEYEGVKDLRIELLEQAPLVLLRSAGVAVARGETVPGNPVLKVVAKGKALAHRKRDREIYGGAEVSGEITLLSDGVVIRKPFAYRIDPDGPEAEIYCFAETKKDAPFGWALVNSGFVSLVSGLIAEIWKSDEVAGLRVALEEGCESLATGAALALASHGDRGLVVLERGLESKTRRVRLAAARGLSKMAKPGLERLVKALGHADPDVRSTAAGGLGQAGDETAVQPLIAAISDPNVGVRNSVVLAMGNLRNAKVLPFLEKALTDADAEVQASAVLALGSFGARALPQLAGALRSNNATVRRWAAIELGKIRSPSAVDGLCGALSDDDQNVRMDSAEALGNIGDPRAVRALLRLSCDEDRVVQYVAVGAVAHIGVRAVDALVLALDDPNTKVRANAARALGKIGDSRAIGPLTNLSRRCSTELDGVAARDALAEIAEKSKR